MRAFEKQVSFFLLTVYAAVCIHDCDTKAGSICPHRDRSFDDGPIPTRADDISIAGRHLITNRLQWEKNGAHPPGRPYSMEDKCDK